MSWKLETPQRVGARVLAVITEGHCAARIGGAHLLATGWKRPVAFAVIEDDATALFDARGQAISAAEFNQRYPTALARVANWISRVDDQTAE